MNNEPDLFVPLKIRELELKNRIAMSPMCMYSSIDGFANDWHLVHLGSRAVGGAALIIAEATAISPEGRISAFDLGIWKDEHIEFLKRITDFISGQGSIPAIQLAHAGRKASQHRPWEGGKPLLPEEGAWQTVAPSAISFSDNFTTPSELTDEGIENIVIDFANAARRAYKAGFKIVEIHAAHGYLLHEFLSPLSNKRTDAYGGNFENRCRIVLRVVKEVRNIWPSELPLFVRISATDWAEGGWSNEDSVALATLLKEAGVDLIDCSSGGNVADARIPNGPGYQVPFAEKIKKETGMLTGAVGLITKTTQAREIIQAEKADLIILGREFLREPYFPILAAKELGVNIKLPVQYERAKR